MGKPPPIIELLQSQGMVFTDREREPEDQFGLMLLACSDLLARGDNVAANRLLEAHLLPQGIPLSGIAATQYR